MKNPLLDDNVFVPDAEAHVREDGRIYLYGSYDIKGADKYCSDRYHVFSSDDMETWVDHGVSFTFPEEWAYDCPYKVLYAPDCAYRNGKYYLYYCIPDGRCGVAVSDRPYGPFEDIGQIKGMQGIDPAVFIDDDGQAYIYWGQFDGVRSAKLNPDMTTIDADSVTQPLSVAEHDFHEGSSVKKINGKYVFVYTDTHRHKDKVGGGMATCLGYAVSDRPQSGFEYRGVIIDNYGCDPGTWNDHGSIECFRGQWYVFYHRSSHGSQFSRRVCAEKISIDENCNIKEVVMTSGELNADEYIKANRACALTGSAFLGGDGMILRSVRPGDTATFRYVSFNGQRKAVIDGCDGEVFIDGKMHDGSPLYGRHEVRLVLTGEGEVRGLRFI